MRYFAELAYKGTDFFGWQIQPEQISVQETIQSTFSTILRTPIEVVGCGRTDTGVHASQYYLHFDFDGEFPQHFLSRVNKFLPPSIAIFRIFPVAEEAHARFDAFHRAYEYRMHFQKDPFKKEISYFYPFPKRPDIDKMQAAAKLLLDYEDFFPFCKTHHDAQTYKCDLNRSEWVADADGLSLSYHIAANRFLRGMVRLIVGMCINVGTGKLELDTVRRAMDEQSRLERSTSAPPEGLYLRDIRYPFLNG
ncbi:tRNA pseudouridine(38-40) synthase TruA [Flavilitoribacter nigricans]|uniref:tRNA pseudouridine synthase A n=1 Tax=Flavilitoribacter nigricans (strain ATCC 23147 / DSM 23189 / NBRC 102662 / NCIMB 1420 / SS-2) TaxID=1122177 RepID=A0A2D0NI13_FLAN2|nr:tRNA pseudouridine(38-40) synthase TruA [Flavilitoribacter nigricans]PHN08058.1 tRNA pseudouridine(38-40) synthase TruA [Flavilitoribacter nigricans DSM 23189 = NBRC 102662]